MSTGIPDIDALNGAGGSPFEGPGAAAREPSRPASDAPAQVIRPPVHESNAGAPAEQAEKGRLISTVI